MSTSKLYKVFAVTIDALKRCIEYSSKPNAVHPHLWIEKHQSKIDRLMDQYAPSGSGIDSGTTLDLEASSDNKLIFHCGYHHMDENGYYDGWTDHTITVKPSLARDFTLTVSGRDRNGIKSYLSDIFYEFLETFIETDLCGFPANYDEDSLEVEVEVMGVTAS